MPACIRVIGSILNLVVMGRNRIGKVELINSADNELDREERIQTAYDEGIISYATAYSLRTGDGL